jgi:hypothetical protein
MTFALDRRSDEDVPVKDPGTGLRAHCPTYAGVRSGSDWALGRDDALASETRPGSRLLTHGEAGAQPRARVTLVRRRGWLVNPRPYESVREHAKTGPAVPAAQGGRTVIARSSLASVARSSARPKPCSVLATVSACRRSRSRQRTGCPATSRGKRRRPAAPRAPTPRWSRRRGRSPPRWVGAAGRWTAR